MKRNPPRVGIVLFPWASKGPYGFVDEIIEIISPLCSSITVITGETGLLKKEERMRIVEVGFRLHYVKEARVPMLSVFSWIFKSVAFQVKTSVEIFKNREYLDLIFFLAYPYHVLPLLTTRILKIRSVEMVTRGKGNIKGVSGIINRFMEKVTYFLCSSIAVETRALANYIGNESSKEKIIGEAARFVNIDRTRNIDLVSNRKCTIAYIGRFRREKGVLEFVQAASSLVKDMNCNILIVGSGDLESDVHSLISRMTPDIKEKIRLRGWATKKEVEEILSEIKILVIPSESEGLPTIVLQSMAMGAIVLSTNVGGLKDIIIDGETGFFLMNNSPKAIVESIEKIIGSSKLDEISQNAMRIINEQYSIEAARGRYLKLLDRALE